MPKREQTKLAAERGELIHGEVLEHLKRYQEMLKSYQRVKKIVVEDVEKVYGDGFVILRNQN